VQKESELAAYVGQVQGMLRSREPSTQAPPLAHGPGDGWQ
jgi:hypothetical protein